MLKLHLTKESNEKIFLFFILYFVAFFELIHLHKASKLQKSSDQKISISIQDFVTTQMKNQLLFLKSKNDLERSGYFKITNIFIFSLKGSVKLQRKFSQNLYC